MAASGQARSGCRSVSAFHKLEKLGEGTYGSVYAARDKETDQLVALKRVKLSGDSLDREGMPQTSLREVGLLRRLRHPHVVSLLEVVVGSKLDSVFLVLERVDHDLSRLIDASPAPFSPPVVKRLALQLFSAIAHLHANYVLHRDLKMSNLLYSDRGVCAGCDFSPRPWPLYLALPDLPRAADPRPDRDLGGLIETSEARVCSPPRCRLKLLTQAQAVRLRSRTARRLSRPVEGRGSVHAQGGHSVVPRPRAAARGQAVRCCCGRVVPRLRAG